MDKVTTVRIHLAKNTFRLEACSGAHEWARRFQPYGHTVKIMAPKFAGPHRRSGKLSGRTRRRFAKIRRAMMVHGPLQRVIRRHDRYGRTDRRAARNMTPA